MLNYYVKFEIIAHEMLEINAALEDLSQQRFNYQIDPKQAIGGKPLDQLAQEQGQKLVDFPIKSKEDGEAFAQAILNLYHKISGCKKYIIDFIKELQSDAIAHGIPSPNQEFIKEELDRIDEEIIQPAEEYQDVLGPLDAKVTPALLQVLNAQERQVLTNIKNQYSKHLNNLFEQFLKAQNTGERMVASIDLRRVAQELLFIL